MIFNILSRVHALGLLPVHDSNADSQYGSNAGAVLKRRFNQHGTRQRQNPSPTLPQEETQIASPMKILAGAHTSSTELPSSISGIYPYRNQGYSPGHSTETCMYQQPSVEVLRLECEQPVPHCIDIEKALQQSAIQAPKAGTIVEGADQGLRHLYSQSITPLGRIPSIPRAMHELLGWQSTCESYRYSAAKQDSASGGGEETSLAHPPRSYSSFTSQNPSSVLTRILSGSNLTAGLGVNSTGEFAGAEGGRLSRALDIVCMVLQDYFPEELAPSMGSIGLREALEGAVQQLGRVPRTYIQQEAAAGQLPPAMPKDSPAHPPCMMTSFPVRCHQPLMGNGDQPMQEMYMPESLLPSFLSWLPANDFSSAAPINTAAGSAYNPEAGFGEGSSDTFDSSAYPYTSPLSGCGILHQHSAMADSMHSTANAALPRSLWDQPLSPGTLAALGGSDPLGMCCGDLNLQDIGVKEDDGSIFATLFAEDWAIGNPMG